MERRRKQELLEMKRVNELQMAAKFADKSRERQKRVLESLGQPIESGELQMRRSIEELPKLNETKFNRNAL